jgi:hypothetical protein
VAAAEVAEATVVARAVAADMAAETGATSGLAALEAPILEEPIS